MEPGDKRAEPPRLPSEDLLKVKINIEGMVTTRCQGDQLLAVANASHHAAAPRNLPYLRHGVALRSLVSTNISHLTARLGS